MKETINAMSETTKLELVNNSNSQERNAMSETTKLELDTYMTGLRYDEGLQLTPYMSDGHRTIGYGHKLTQAEMRVKHITLEQAEKLLLEDTVKAICDARVVCKNFDTLSLPRKSVLVTMAFNLGRHRLKKFTKFLAAIDCYDYNTATVYLIETKWFRQIRSGAKAQRLIRLMQEDSDIAIN